MDKELRDDELIGACGMNCGLCVGYLSMKNDLHSQGIKERYCAGCRLRMGKFCAFAKRCELLKNRQVKYCYECDKFPCDNLAPLDKRYQKKYHMSMIENLNYIKEHSMEKFLAREEEKWKCPECGEVISCHNGICHSCSVEKLRTLQDVRDWTGG